MKIFKQSFALFIFLLFLTTCLNGQNGEIFTLTDAALKGDTPVELNKLPWKFHAGDDRAWSARDLDDANWETIEGTTVKPEMITQAEWNGRAWFRLRFRIEEKLINQNIVLTAAQKGASEIFVDGELLAKFGEITDTNVDEYNPNRLPIPFRLGSAGEHSIAIRFATSTFQNTSDAKTRWLMNGGVSPGISPAFLDGGDLGVSIGGYANYAAMRGGFLFGGILLALALLHFLLYLFYRVERANLYYSLYAGAFGIYILCNNFKIFGHLGILPSIAVGSVAIAMLAAAFTGLLAFTRVAFNRPLGIVFWIMTILWATTAFLNMAFLNNAGFFQLLPNILIGLTFTFSIYQLITALREKRAGAWILLGGVQIYAAAMTLALLSQLKVFSASQNFYFLLELVTLLAVPIAVSVYLARNFARTNRDLQTKLIQVEELGLQKIEQERQSAELRAENERRAKELEEARQLQLSMLPRKLPNINGLEIAAYMKPATEVGGDYYDFHVSEDGTLTVAVGDATGHGLKAGTVVTATKSLFNNLAAAPDIPNTFGQISQSLKAMNLRGLFMAMTMLKIKGDQFSISAAGMPSTLVYRSAAQEVEEINLRALPLGGIAGIKYQQQQFVVSENDLIVLMSDGFPEMFNEAGEMLGDDHAKRILRESADLSPQEIIDQLVKVGEDWANRRAQDDDVTFVVLKVKS